MARLTRDLILAAPDIRTEEVNVEEWGGSVLVRGLTGAERDAYEATVVTLRGKRRELNLANVRAKLCALCIVDDAGQRLFSDADIAKLGEKSGAALQRVFKVAQQLSGLSDEDVEELSKN